MLTMATRVRTRGQRACLKEVTRLSLCVPAKTRERARSHTVGSATTPPSDGNPSNPIVKTRSPDAYFRQFGISKPKRLSSVSRNRTTADNSLYLLEAKNQSVRLFKNTDTSSSPFFFARIFIDYFVAVAVRCHRRAYSPHTI
jgi:hypothetical protein